MKNVRYAVRSLLSHPGFALVAVLTLALGIGANSAIFSVINGLLLRPPPFRDPGRLMFLWQVAAHDQMLPVSVPDYLDWKKQAKSFDAMSAYRSNHFTLASAGGEPVRVEGRMASFDFLPLLGVEPQLGRGFTAADDTPSADPVVILGQGLWQRRFGAERSILGRSVRIDGRAFTVIGVMPFDFRLPSTSDADLWVPLSTAGEDLLSSRGSHSNLFVVAHLRPGAEASAAVSEMETINAQLVREYPGTNTGQSIGMAPLGEHMVEDARPALLVLWAAVAFVLLIACANVASLLLSRASARHREVAIRRALGAGGRHLTSQFVVEGVVLALLGGGAGLILANWSVAALRMTVDSPSLAESLRIDSTVLLFTAMLSLGGGVLLGILPALKARSLDISESLKAGSPAVGHRSRRSTAQGILVVVEMALAILLLTGAGLMLRSLMNLTAVAPGFDPHRLIVASVALSEQKYPDSSQRLAFTERMISRMQSIPGVESVAAADLLPLTGNSSATSIQIEGAAPPPPGESSPSVHYQTVSADYFRTMSVPLIEGRSFDRKDREGSQRVIVVDRPMARRFWPGDSAVGKRVRIRGNWHTVVGVAGAVKYHALDRDTPSQMYFPLLQHPGGGMNLVLRAQADPSALASAVRSSLHALDPDMPVEELKTMDEIVGRSLTSRRYPAILLVLFAAVALLLAGIGVYGVMMTAVQQRVPEIGIRMALGASQSDVLRSVIGRGMALALSGAALGLVAAVPLTRTMGSMLYGVAPTEPLTFGLVTVVLLGVALLACWVPARRAVSVDPMISLRQE